MSGAAWIRSPSLCDSDTSHDPLTTPAVWATSSCVFHAAPHAVGMRSSDTGGLFPGLPRASQRVCLGRLEPQALLCASAGRGRRKVDSVAKKWQRIPQYFHPGGDGEGVTWGTSSWQGSEQGWGWGTRRPPKLPCELSPHRPSAATTRTPGGSKWARPQPSLPGSSSWI